MKPRITREEATQRSHAMAAVISKALTAAGIDHEVSTVSYQVSIECFPDKNKKFNWCCIKIKPEGSHRGYAREITFDKLTARISKDYGLNRPAFSLGEKKVLEDPIPLVDEVKLLLRLRSEQQKLHADKTAKIDQAEARINKISNACPGATQLFSLNSRQQYEGMKPCITVSASLSFEMAEAVMAFVEGKLKEDHARFDG